MSDDTSKPSTVTLRPNKPRARVATTAPVAATEAPATRVVGGAQEGGEGAAIKKKDFIDRVVERSGGKRRDVKPAVEAALAELADLLAGGTELNLPPMGKLKPVKTRDLGEGATMVTLKLRTQKDGAGSDTDGKDGVAKDGEDG